MLRLRELRFLWWNVCDFAHFDPAMAERADGRWPSSEAMFREKLRRINSSLTALFGNDLPELIGLCEITRGGAGELGALRLADYNTFFSRPDGEDGFQIVVFVKRNAGVTLKKLPLVAQSVPDSTRPMPLVEFRGKEGHIRFAFCHWPAFDEPASQEHRGRVADALRADVYKFMRPSKGLGVPRHYVALGDFNAEPFDDLFELKLYAYRDRERSRQRPHHTDPHVERTRLYNCGWRHLGEHRPHDPGTPSAEQAGTYYQASTRTWRTFDQVLVTGGLLSAEAPYLDESRLLVRTDTATLTDADKPGKFAFVGDAASGFSDHLPITGSIVLSYERATMNEMETILRKAMETRRAQVSTALEDLQRIVSSMAKAVETVSGGQATLVLQKLKDS